MERLQKILSRAGLASRREAERWILEGRVSVNGTIISKMGSQADPTKDSIKVDGKRIKPAAAPLYFAFHKPPGVLTTLNDPQKRPDLTQFTERLGSRQRVFPVGRPDYTSPLRREESLPGKVERLSHRSGFCPVAQRHPVGRRCQRTCARAGCGETEKKRLGRN